MIKHMKKMVQYSIWPNCCNSCAFCLRKDRSTYTVQQQINSIRFIRKNIDNIDWKNDFSYGISLLGGEAYYIQDKNLQNEFLMLIDDIIQKILITSTNKDCKFSTVTNGLYDPAFLYTVLDKFKNSVGMKRVDINFSYDFKYRYKDDNDRKLALANINAVHDKYDYEVGVQMITTQHLIDAVKNKQFSINSFIANDIPGNQLSLLYPHPIKTGHKLDDFFFTRDSLLWFVNYLKEHNIQVYKNFMYSTLNSGTFKYTGFRCKDDNGFANTSQQPVLSDGKEKINPCCGHSILYKCYSDCDKCMLCDLKLIDNDLNC